MKTKSKTKKLAKRIQSDSRFDPLDVPAGQVRRRVGDVFYLIKESKYVIESVSPSRATARCMGATRLAKVQKGKEADPNVPIEYEVIPAYISISTCCDRGDVLEHIPNYQPPRKPSKEEIV